VAQRAQVIEFGEAEAGRIDGGDRVPGLGRPAAGGTLTPFDVADDLFSHRRAGTEPGEPGPVHRIPVGHDVTHCGVDIDHGAYATGRT
jgi:hypothetical protein